jgi:hypothetical protein
LHKIHHERPRQIIASILDNKSATMMDFEKANVFRHAQVASSAASLAQKPSGATLHRHQQRLLEETKENANKTTCAASMCRANSSKFLVEAVSLNLQRMAHDELLIAHSQAVSSSSSGHRPYYVHGNHYRVRSSSSSNLNLVFNDQDDDDSTTTTTTTSSSSASNEAATMPAPTSTSTSTQMTAAVPPQLQTQSTLLQVSRLRRRNQRSLLLQIQEEQQRHLQQQQHDTQSRATTNTPRVLTWKPSVIPEGDDSSLSDDDQVATGSFE